MIELDADQKTPLYEQLYAALADEIRTGQRAPGTPLPGRRTMAAQQGVSVNTVDAAYQMLAAEGLAEPRPRSGFYVQKTYGMLHSRARRAPAPQPPAAPQPVYDLSTGSKLKYVAAVTASAFSGLLVNVFTDPFIGYFRNLYIFGQPAEFVSVVTKIASGVTLVNSLLSTVCAVVLYIALRPALEKAHLLPKE